MHPPICLGGHPRYCFSNAKSGWLIPQLLLGSLNASCSRNFTMLGCTENVAIARTLREYWS